MFLAILYTGLAVFVTVKETEGAQPCKLQWSSDLPSWFPLIWNNSEIVYPKDNGSQSWAIQMPPKTSVKIGCSDSLNLLKSYMLPEITLACNGYGQLRVGSLSSNFSNLGCLNPIKETVIESGTCYNQYTHVDIEFLSLLSMTQFPLINICHNENDYETIMASHIIHGSAFNPIEVSNKRPSFKKAQFYPTISVDDAYSQKQQLAVVSKLVGSATLGARYIDPLRSFYFARGHLAPDGDFIHIYEQNATYYYINVIPQWQIINNGNWKAMEIAIRQYAISNKVDLQVWTGGKGVLQLPDVNGNPVKIYLDEDSTGKKLLPAPEISWKVIQDATTKAAVAIFMINNPYLQVVPSELISCNNVCSEISWVTWNTTSIQKGYTHCCEMKEAKTLLPSVPDLGDVQLLI